MKCNKASQLNITDDSADELYKAKWSHEKIYPIRQANGTRLSRNNCHKTKNKKKSDDEKGENKKRLKMQIFQNKICKIS